jgi:hypothetical protein
METCQELAPSGFSCLRLCGLPVEHQGLRSPPQPHRRWRKKKLAKNRAAPPTGPRLAHSHVPMGVHSVARLERRQAVLREGRRSGRNSKLQSPNREGAARARACTRSSDMGEDSGPGSVRSKLDEATRSWRSAQGCSGVVRDQLCHPAWRDSWREQLPEPPFPLQSDESSPCLQTGGCRFESCRPVPLFMHKPAVSRDRPGDSREPRPSTSQHFSARSCEESRTTTVLAGALHAVR